MTEPTPDWILNTPSTPAIHTQPAKAGGEFTTPFTPASLFQIGEKLLEGFLSKVVQALVGVFIPGGSGAAFTQLQAWATRILGIVPATIKLFTDILTFNWLAIPGDLLSLAGLGVDAAPLSSALSQSVTSAPAVTPDASSFGSVNTGNPTSYTKPHRTGPAANMGMTVHVAIGPLAPKAYAPGFVTVTYNGVALERKGGIDSGHGTNGWLELFTLTGAATGLHDVVVTTAQPVHSIAASINTYAGVGSFSGFVSGATNAESQSLAVRGTPNGVVVVGMAAGNSISGASAGTQRTAENVDMVTNAGNLIVADAPGADSVTVTAGGSPAQVLIDLAASVTAGGLSVNIPLAAAVTAGGSTLAPFVTRDPSTGNLMLGGTQFRWGGSGYGPGGLSEDTLDTTTYSALNPTYTDSVTFTTGSPVGPAAVHLPNHAETDAQIAAMVALNTRVTRSFALLSIGSTLAVMPSLGTYDPVAETGSLALNSNTFETVDYALAQLAANNIRVIFPLVDNYDYFTHGKFTWCTLCGVTPDGSATQFFSTTKIKNAFKKYISAVLNHVNVYTGVKYKDDPTILAWETGNELDNGTVYDSTITTWTDEISTHIKVTEGAQQLVADGVFGLTGSSGDWTTFATGRLALTNTDMCSTHSYDASRTPANILLEARKAKDAKKAFYLGEYPANGGSMAVTVDVLHQELADSLEVDGTNFWSLHGVGITHPGAFQLHAGDGNASKFGNHAALIRTLTTTGYLADAFAAANGTALTAHVADSGDMWAVQAGSSPGGKIQSNRLYFDATSYLYSSSRPPAPDYDVTANIRLVSAVTNSQVGVSGRMLETSQTLYYAFVYYSAGWYVYLYRFLGGSGAELTHVSLSPQPTVGTDHTLTLRMVGDQISVLWDAATVIGPITDGYIKAAGKAGVNGTAVTPSTGAHIDSITVA